MSNGLAKSFVELKGLCKKYTGLLLVADYTGDKNKMDEHNEITNHLCEHKPVLIKKATLLKGNITKEIDANINALNSDSSLSYQQLTDQINIQLADKAAYINDLNTIIEAIN